MTNEEFDIYFYPLKSLIGKEVSKILVDNVHDEICFVTDDGLMSFICEGDCCSSTWIEHISGVSAMINATVISAEIVDIETISDHPVHDCLQIYAWKIKTTKGYFDIDFRNSSNGYYGGSLKRNLSPSRDLRELKEDF